MSHYIMNKNDKNKKKPSLIQDAISSAESLWNSIQHGQRNKVAKTPKQKKYDESSFY